MKTKNKELKVIDQFEEFDRNYGRVVRFIEFKQKRFKIYGELSNGRGDLAVKIMDSDGVFQYVLNKYDIGYNYVASYVSDDTRKKEDILKGISQMEDLIIKLYS